jgi:hypothetical protein
LTFPIRQTYSVAQKAQNAAVAEKEWGTRFSGKAAQVRQFRLPMCRYSDRRIEVVPEEARLRADREKPV